MLRFAEVNKTYEITVSVGGQSVKLKLKSLSLGERLEILDVISKTKGLDGFGKCFEAMDRVVLEIDGKTDKPSVVLPKLEHMNDFNDILKGVVKWLSLDEQESKNFSSSSEQPTPGTAGSAVKNAGAEGGDA